MIGKGEAYIQAHTSWYVYIGSVENVLKGFGPTLTLAFFHEQAVRSRGDNQVRARFQLGHPRLHRRRVVGVRVRAIRVAPVLGHRRHLAARVWCGRLRDVEPADVRQRGEERGQAHDHGGVGRVLLYDGEQRLPAGERARHQHAEQQYQDVGGADQRCGLIVALLAGTAQQRSSRASFLEMVVEYQPRLTLPYVNQEGSDYEIGIGDASWSTLQAAAKNAYSTTGAFDFSDYLP